MAKENGHQQRSRQRRQIWHYDPRCHWCGCVTVLLEGRGQHEKEYPLNMATLDHLDSRLNPERGQHRNEYRRVLACLKCNLERCRNELKTMLPQDLWEQSGQTKRIAKMTGALNEV